MKRRNFIKNASLTSVGITMGASAISCNEKEKSSQNACSFF